MVTQDGLAPNSEQTTRHRKPSSFLLPRESLRATAQRALSLSVSCCAPGLFRERNTNLFAPRVILGFIPRMNSCVTADSKLCALLARHAPDNFLAEIAAAQLGKEGETPSVASFPRPPEAAPGKSETVPVFAPSELRRDKPVSAPFGFRGVVVFRSWGLRP
jgi:hypothetical protein